MKTDESLTADEAQAAVERNGGFTLTELLVVMAILGVFAALLAPAMARSGDNRARTVCFNNLRQLGVALNLYTAEHQDTLPWPNWGNDSGPCPAGWLYAGDPSSSPSTIAAGGSPAITYWALRQLVHLKGGVFWQYVQNGNTFICPNDLKPSQSGLWAKRMNTLSSYVMNGAAAYYPAPNSQYGYSTAKQSQIWSPFCYLLWEPDQNLDNGCFNDGANYPGKDNGGAGNNEGIGMLHGPGGNILSLNGDARFISSVDYQSQLAIPGQNLLFWNPKSVVGR